MRRLAGYGVTAGNRRCFPAGRRFGYIAYPPRPDGQPTFNEGYTFTGDAALIPARVVQAPWLTRLQGLGEDVSLVRETDSGTVQIEGETVFSTHDIHHNDDTYSVYAMKNEIPNFPALQQAGVRSVHARTLQPFLICEQE